MRFRHKNLVPEENLICLKQPVYAVRPCHQQSPRLASEMDEKTTDSSLTFKRACRCMSTGQYLPNTTKQTELSAEERL